MKRDLKTLANSNYDLLVIGGGITGAFTAWDAVLRGLSVALVDKGDFGAATSAASGKIIHGGVRYLQYGAFHRLRESLHERMVFQRIAPQFVHPIPFVIPTYGHLLKSKGVLNLAMTLYDVLSRDKIDKTVQNDPQKAIPPHRLVSKEDVLRFFPYLNETGLTGGVLYFDCQMHNPERLTLSFLLSAHGAGAVIANYLKVTGFITEQNRIVGVNAEDGLAGNRFPIRAKMVVNASGPWASTLLENVIPPQSFTNKRLSKGVHIITRSLAQGAALALSSKQRHAGALMQRDGRHFFIIPWRNHNLIGTTNVPFQGQPDEKMVSENDIAGLMDEINGCCNAKILNREDVLHFYGGLYPDDIKKGFEEGYQGTRKDQLIDHAKSDNIQGLITAIGVKYTTARKLAQKIIDRVFMKKGYTPPTCKTEESATYGGEIESFTDFVAKETEKRDGILDGETRRYLIYNHGIAYGKLMDYIAKNPDDSMRLSTKLPTVRVQAIHAVREEMAQKLSDVVFRRTDLGTLGNPGEDALRSCASIMATELGWDEKRVEQELTEVQGDYRTT